MPRLKSLLLPLLLFLYTLLFCRTASAGPYRNLVLEGGGVRGIAYAGAIRVLEDAHITDSLERVAGTSVGGISAAVLSVGYRSKEIEEILGSLRIQQFNDGRWFFIGGASRMLHRFGWYRGDALEHWIGRLLAAKTGQEDLTFGQLHALAARDRRFKDLYIPATNLSRQQRTVFSWESHPDMEIRTAVRASMSVPLYFSAVMLNARGHKVRPGEAGEVFVDGGVVANYPLGLFDKDGVENPQTLGLKLERPAQLDYFDSSRGIAPYEIHKLPDYVAALYNIIIETMNRDAAFVNEASRTVYISTGNINPRVRKMTKAQKDLLVSNGREGARRYLSGVVGR